MSGNSDATLINKQYGRRDYQNDRNHWHQNGHDAFMVELSKYAMDRRDLPANINWFSKCSVAGDGGIVLIDGHPPVGNDSSFWPDARQCREGSPVLYQREASEGGVSATYRVAGDRFLLVEYGLPHLDLVSRFRVHALMQWLENYSLTGIVELTPGIRSLQLHYDSQRLTLPMLLDHLLRAETQLDSIVDSAVVPSRIVHIPLSWDDEACKLAIEKYD